MKKLTAEFVEASEVFNGIPLAWEEFANSDPDCSWGNNNRTLVLPDVIIDALEESEEPQVAVAMKRLSELGDTYVDLEN